MTEEEFETYLKDMLYRIFDRAIHIDGVIPGAPYLSKALAFELKDMRHDAERWRYAYVVGSMVPPGVKEIYIEMVEDLDD